MSRTHVAGLRVLVVDDEAPARDELAWLLEREPLAAEVASVEVAASATDALRLLQGAHRTPEEHDGGPFDVVLLDISMPGLDGLELAAVLRRFREPPAVVFVTAHEQHAVDAFELEATDYVLKPVRAERLALALRRAAAARGGPPPPGEDPHRDAATPETTAPTEPDPDPQVAVERAGVTRFVRRSAITHVEAQGDYARLHVGPDSYLVRVPLAQLAEEWGPAGFVRIHRSTLVSLAHVEELRTETGRCSVVVGSGRTRVELTVSRRHTRELRDVLLRVRT